MNQDQFLRNAASQTAKLVKFATCIISSRGLFLLSAYSCRYQLTLRIPVLCLILKHMKKIY